MKIQASSRRGSAMCVTVFCLLVLAVLAAQTLSNISSRSRTAQRSTAWNEALVTAASGVDTTVAELTSLLPDVRLNTQGLTLAPSQFPTSILSSLSISSSGLNLANGLTLSFQPAPLTHGGEAVTTAQATVMIDVLPLSQILNGSALTLGNVVGLLSNPLSLINGGSDLQLVRLRSRGTVYMNGSRRPDIVGLDSQLRRPSLVWDRLTNQRATQPSISREVEVLLAPVLAFQSAATTSGQLSLPSGTVVDSFNSLTPFTSTNGLYDATKRLTHGTLIANTANVQLGGQVYGDVKTNGANIQASPSISGTINNGYSQTNPQINVPSWATAYPTLAPPGSSLTIAAGTFLLPNRLKFNSLNGSVHITKGLLGLGTNVEIYVLGDVTGSITIDPGVQVKIYLGGNMRLTAGKLVNGSQLAVNLQIYGLGDDPPSGPRGIEIGLGNVSAAIYAPLHNVVLTGAGNFQGAITSATLTTSPGAQIHFDEGLGLNVGPILRFGVTSWIERQL